jgi:hypothetical protein
MTETAAPKITAKELKEFFGYEKLADFSRDWKELSEEERAQIRGGIADGTFNY